MCFYIPAYSAPHTVHSTMTCPAAHTLAPTAKKAILGFGLREAERSPDRNYQYGYGRAAFFYSLLTALSTFGFGAVYTFVSGNYIRAPSKRRPACARALTHCPHNWRPSTPPHSLTRRKRSHAPERRA